MSSLQKTILVIGATGQQGSAVIRQSLAKGWTIRALVRDLQKAGAQLLRRQGVEVVQVRGRATHYQKAPVEQDQDLEGARKASEFLEKEDCKADIAALRQIHPQLLSFASWLRQAN